MKTLCKLWCNNKTAIFTACFNNLNSLGVFRWMGDKPFLSMAYYMHTGRRMNWKSPKRFTEKIQWLKVYGRKGEYTRMVDKLSAKDYVASRIGWKYIIPTFGVWEHFDDIDFDQLPDQFVLKTSNGSGSNGVVICLDKRKLEKQKAKRTLEASLKCNTYYNLREWPYKNIHPQIFAEQLLYEDPKAFKERPDLTDYKFYCFSGVPKFCQVIQGRSTHESIDFFDAEWNLQPFIGLNPAATHAKVLPSRPNHFDEMLSIARQLSVGIPFVRIDLYEVQGELKFGEITFYPASGLGKFSPDNYDKLLGEMFDIKSES